MASMPFSRFISERRQRSTIAISSKSEGFLKAFFSSSSSRSESAVTPLRSMNSLTHETGFWRSITESSSRLVLVGSRLSSWHQCSGASLMSPASAARVAAYPWYSCHLLASESCMMPMRTCSFSPCASSISLTSSSSCGCGGISCGSEADAPSIARCDCRRAPTLTALRSACTHRSHSSLPSA